MRRRAGGPGSRRGRRAPHPATPYAPLFPHEDPLAVLNTSATLKRKIEAVHEEIFNRVEGIDRIAIATYDPATDVLKTFIASGVAKDQLVYYDARLADSPSLQSVLKAGRPRVVNNLQLFQGSPHAHAQIIQTLGFRSSYTMPMYQNGVFWGFIFFNSLQPAVFTPEVLRTLDPFGHLIALLVTTELLSVRILAAAVKTAHDMVHFRDPETGAHIDRMSRYARLIARSLAASGAHRIDDRMIEQIFEFAPLHDIGKIAVPDRILLKKGHLSAGEREVMKTHTTRGLQMVDALARNFGLEHLEGLDILRHIAEDHHETLDGKGYPHGLRGGEIPIEARIVAVADVFDALTSERPYKRAWTNPEAFAMLRKLAVEKLDAECVDALIFNEPEVKKIQAQFRDEVREPAVREKKGKR